MYDIISKTGIFSLRNLMTYRLIGTTITEKIGEQVLDIDYIVPLIKNNHNLHCISCITYDILSTSLLIYVVSYYASREPTTIKKIEKIESYASLKKLVGRTLWIILFIFTKNVEHSS
jgi:hypothetical protein